MPSDLPPEWAAFEALLERDGRYRREAYAFVLDALGRVAQALPAERRADPARRHLSGGELLEGAIEHARREFGVMAPTVFREWGVATGEDIGRIVFQLVEAGILSARPEDSLDDFRHCDDLLARVTPPGSGRRRR